MYLKDSWCVVLWLEAEMLDISVSFMVKQIHFDLLVGGWNVSVSNYSLQGGESESEPFIAGWRIKVIELFTTGRIKMWCTAELAIKKS